MKKKSNYSLTRRAGLTAISQILEQVARLIVGFGVTPFVIRGLGAELYGAWTMIRQSVGYLSLTDLKPTGTLKLTLAVSQHSDDVAEKRRQIGSALGIWAFSFPVFLVLGGLTIWILPSHIHVQSEYGNQVRWTVAIVIVSVLINRIISLPASVLRGMNVEYKAMGVNTSVIFLDGGLMALAVFMGWGLPGIAGASVLGIVISGLLRLLIARGVFSWFGASKPEKEEFLKFAGFSFWMALTGLGTLLLTASDFLLIGFLLGPAFAAVYATTGAVIRITADPLLSLLSSASPGLVGVCGRGDWQRAMKVRTEMFVIGMACMAFLGVGIMMLNKAFIGLWVGQDYFGGQITNVLLVLVAIAKLWFRIDNIIIAGMLEVKRMALSRFVCGAIVLISGLGLISLWGLPGMACSSLLGYVSQWGYYQYLIKHRSKLSMRAFVVRLVQAVVMTVPVFWIAFLSFERIVSRGWFDFFSMAILISALVACYIWFVFLNAHDRRTIMARVHSAKF